jgi:hypothetical protein
MKLVPKVNTDGLYLEDEKMSDDFYGVTPVYADPVEGQDGSMIPDEPIGYNVGVPITVEGLYKPKFDLLAWKTYQEAVYQAEEAFILALNEWQENGAVEEDRPSYIPPKQPDKLWSEGMTQAEIDEINKPDTSVSVEDRIAELEKAFADFVMSGL